MQGTDLTDLNVSRMQSPIFAGRQTLQYFFTMNSSRKRLSARQTQMKLQSLRSRFHGKSRLTHHLLTSLVRHLSSAKDLWKTISHTSFILLEHQVDFRNPFRKVTTLQLECCHPSVERSLRHSQQPRYTMAELQIAFELGPATP